MNREYLTLPEVLTIHEDQIDAYGGAEGVRDLGQLEAALFRPQSGYYRDVIAEAVALWESLAQSHPFVDGNKRVAFASMYTFLLLNGMILTADADQAWDFISRLYEEGAFKFEQLDGWLRENAQAIQ